MSRIATRRHALVLLVVALAAVALFGVVSVHLVAQDAVTRSRDTTFTSPERLAAAHEALRLEPWRRDIVGEAALIEAAMLQDQGDLDGAKRVLVAALARDATGRELRRLLTRVNQEILIRDARKAHQQHAHEGSDGSLRPEDVER